jgi:hypothetical protein
MNDLIEAALIEAMHTGNWPAYYEMLENISD